MSNRQNIKWCLLSFFIITIMIFFAGCSKKNQKSDSQEKEIIQFWLAENYEGEGELYKKNIDAYNKKNNEVFVEFSIKPWDKTPMNVALQAQTPPDVVSSWFSPPSDTYENLRINLIEYLTDEERNDFGPEVLAKVSDSSEKIYTWPYHITQSTWILANGDILKKVGVDPINIQQYDCNWEEFLTVCKKISKMGIYGYGDAESSHTITHLLSGYLGPSLSKDMKFMWNDNNAVGILDRYANLIYKDKVMPKEVLGIDISGLHQKFMKGEIGIIRSYSPWISTLEKGGDISKVYILPYPDQGKMKFKSGLGVGGLSVFKRPDASKNHIQEVIKFVRYISRPISGIFAPMQWYGLPAAKSVRKSFIESQQIKDSNYVFVSKKTDEGQISPPSTTVGSKIQEIVKTYASEAMSNKTSPSEAIRKWTTESLKLLQ